MPTSLNVRFFGDAKPDTEFDHPAGASIARLIQSRLQAEGWTVSEFDNWRDCGWSMECLRDGARMFVAFSQIELDVWMLQVSPASMPSSLGRLFGGKPSALAENVMALGKCVHRILLEAGAFSGFQWCWDDFPDRNNSTIEPGEAATCKNVPGSI